VEAWKNGSTNFNSPTLSAFTGTTSLNPSLGGQILLNESRTAAAAAGLVHGAWFEYGNMSQFLGNTGTATSGFNALSRKLRDATWTVGTTSGTGWLLRDPNGNYTTGSNGFVWMNPLVPEVRNLIKGIVTDAINQFDLQIVQFDDHLAWPQAYGWDSYTAAVYKQETGRNLPASITDSNFAAWRRGKTQDFFAEVSDAAKAAKPSVIVSLSPSVISTSSNSFCFDWTKSMTKTDEVLPQTYTNVYTGFEVSVDTQLSASRPNDSETGLGLKLAPGSIPATPWSVLEQQIDYTRTKNALGHSIWYSDGISASGTAPAYTVSGSLAAYYDVPTNGIAANPHFQSTRWSGTGGNGGSGTWSQIAAQWKDTSTIWVSSGTGIFDGVGGTVTISGSVMAEAGLDFRTTGYTVTGGTLAFRGVFRADNLVNVASGATTTLAALVTGSTGLTKAGAGTLAITGSATGLTGGIQIDAGTLQVGASGTVGSLNASTPITVAAGGTLAFNRSDTYGGNIANVISGSGGVTLLSGSLGLSGSNSYTGGTLVRGGTLALAAGGAINHGAGNVTLGSTTGDVATLALSQGTITGSNGMLGSGSGATGSATVSGGTWSSLGSMTIGQSGSGSLVLTGSGRVNVGSGTGTIALAANPLSSGSLVLSSGLTSGTLQAGTITGGSGAALAAFQQSGTYAVQPALAGSLAVTQSGSGTTILAGANTYAGATTISAGVLQVGAGGTTGFIGSGTVVNNATLVFNRSDDYGGAGSANATRSITGSGTVQLQAGSLALSGSSSHAGGTVLRGGTLSLTPTGAISHGAANMVVGSVAGDSATLSLPAGTLTGSTGLVGSGSGAVGVATVSGSGTWTNNGSLTVGQSGTGTLSIVGAGLVRVGGTAGNGTLTLASGSGSRGTLNIGSGSLSGTLQAGIVTGGAGAATVNFNHTSGSYAFAPRLTGTLAVTHAGPGRTVLSGSNTYTGTTTISSGTLQFANRAALYGGGTASWTAANLVTGSAATLALSVGGSTGFTAADVDRLDSLGTATGGFRPGSTLGLDTTNAASGTFAYANAIANPNGGANGLGLAKLGAGTLVLSGSNTFTGPTTVAQGTLQLGNAGALSSSAVTVAAGATLAVSPQVAAAVPALANNGLVDVGLGGLTVTSGQTAAALMAGIGAGRNGGTWDGATGITSTAAAGMTDRAVGWIDNGGGSFTVGFAAAGDLDMNGLVDLDDVIAFVSSSLYDTGLPSVWAQGDYDYNSIVDLDDVIAFVSGGLYDAGPYNAAPAGMSLAGLADDPSLMNGGFAAVPEPTAWALAALGAGIAAGWRRRLAVSSSACRRR
jgi:autotransporter-associated beta strand protein